MESKIVNPPIERFGQIETNLGAIARQIFGQPPAKPFSYRLGLDHPVPPGHDPAEYHQEILMTLLIMGTHHLYGPIRPDQITPTQLERLTDYMISFGYVPKVIIMDGENEVNGSWKERFSISFHPYQYPSRRF